MLDTKRCCVGAYYIANNSTTSVAVVDDNHNLIGVLTQSMLLRCIHSDLSQMREIKYVFSSPFSSPRFHDGDSPQPKLFAASATSRPDRSA